MVPPRLIDYEALWSSDKLAACAPWAQAEYAWLYGLADPNGSFELTNLRVIWGKVAAIRKELSFDRLQQIFVEFEAQGLLFTWFEGRKRYAHWTGSDKPGRLPRQSWRKRLKRFAPDVPQDQLLEYIRMYPHTGLTDERDDLTSGVGVGARGVVEQEKEGAPESGAARAPARPRPSPSAFSGAHLTVSEKQDRLLAEAFPWVDRPIEYRKANAWLDANPQRRPRKTAKFVYNWFSKIAAPSGGAKGTVRAEERTRNNLAAAGFPVH